MTRQELGITDIGLQYINAILRRAEVERMHEATRLASPAGAVNIYQKQMVEAEAAVQFWQNKSHEEWCAVMKKRGWYQD